MVVKSGGGAQACCQRWWWTCGGARVAAARGRAEEAKKPNKNGEALILFPIFSDFFGLFFAYLVGQMEDKSQQITQV